MAPGCDSSRPPTTGASRAGSVGAVLREKPRDEIRGRIAALRRLLGWARSPHAHVLTGGVSPGIRLVGIMVAMPVGTGIPMKLGAVAAVLAVVVAVAVGYAVCCG